MLLDTIYNLKGPSTFSSNLQRIVNYATHDLHKCKSHDWHVIMQLVPLLFKHCFSKHKDLRRAIMQISITVSLLCEKVVNREHIVAAKLAVTEAICVLEKYFPPAFFDISVHLLVHLCDEALLCDPVRYRWMYPFEILMEVFIHDTLQVQLQRNISSWSHQYILGNICLTRPMLMTLMSSSMMVVM